MSEPTALELAKEIVAHYSAHNCKPVIDVDYRRVAEALIRRENGVGPKKGAFHCQCICGASVERRWEYCPWCGTKLKRGAVISR